MLKRYKYEVEIINFMWSYYRKYVHQQYLFVDRICLQIVFVSWKIAFHSLLIAIQASASGYLEFLLVILILLDSEEKLKVIDSSCLGESSE